jgi:uncharacterized protein YndB with AHSA1/START domain
MTERVVARRIEASPEQVWSTLAAYGEISRWVPEVDHSCLLRTVGDDRELGVGVVRRNQIGRLTVLERVTSWEEPERLAYSIEGLPKVVRTATNEWVLEPIDEAATRVSIASTVDCGPRPPQELVSRVVAGRLAKTSVAMLDGLARHLARTTVEGTTR